MKPVFKNKVIKFNVNLVISSTTFKMQDPIECPNILVKKFSTPGKVVFYKHSTLVYDSLFELWAFTNSL